MAGKKKDTHEAVLTIKSTGQGDVVQVTLEFKPNLTGDDLVAMGYQPAAHMFVENWVLPMLEASATQGMHPEMGQEPTGGIN